MVACKTKATARCNSLRRSAATPGAASIIQYDSAVVVTQCGAGCCVHLQLLVAECSAPRDWRGGGGVGVQVGGPVLTEHPGASHSLTCAAMQHTPCSQPPCSTQSLMRDHADVLAVQAASDVRHCFGGTLRVVRCVAIRVAQSQ
jgi:hypothetical protein